MNLFAKLLARLSTSKTTSARRPHAFDRRRVADTIDRALASAGLVQRREETTATGRVDAVATPAPVANGEFISLAFSSEAGTRAYKLFVPTCHESATRARFPLIVMLHGCTQTPDDFATGTRMNALAEVHGFLVAYPEQAPKANGAKCWNWFRAEDQAHGRGEPSLIAGITRAVTSHYRVDEQRVFIAGLSAGAAMAVILGQTYPDVFAAVGAHSGLPFGAAHDATSAFAAMKGNAGATKATVPTGAPEAASRHATPAVRTIVFHGDADRTVDPRNGLAIVREATRAKSAGAPLRASVHDGAVVQGRAYVREVFVDRAARPVVEYWTVRGAGHAWSGGSANGSYTDPTGPDASAEMVRFFLQ